MQALQEHARQAGRQACVCKACKHLPACAILPILYITQRTKRVHSYQRKIPEQYEASRHTNNQTPPSDSQRMGGGVGAKDERQAQPPEELGHAERGRHGPAHLHRKHTRQVLNQLALGDVQAEGDAPAATAIGAGPWWLQPGLRDPHLLVGVQLCVLPRHALVLHDLQGLALGGAQLGQLVQHLWVGDEGFKGFKGLGHGLEGFKGFKGLGHG